MILIVGGTGAMGSALARRLLAEGKPVQVMTRSPDKVASLQRSGARVVQGNLLDKDSLRRACNGVEAVVAAAHSIFGRGKEASKWVDLQGNKDLIDAAKAEGVHHFIFCSLHDDGPAYQQIPFWRMKYAVEQYLRDSWLPYTILRATAFMDSHAEVLIGRPILLKGKVTLFGRGDKLRNFVAADDVARVALLALQDPQARGQTIDIGGPENLTNLQVVSLYEKLTGRAAKVSRIPLGVLQVMYRVMRPFHPGLSQVMQASICIDTRDSIFDPTPLLARYQLKLTCLEDWAKRRLESGAVSTTSPAA